MKNDQVLNQFVRAISSLLLYGHDNLIFGMRDVSSNLCQRKLFVSPITSFGLLKVCFGQVGSMIIVEFRLADRSKRFRPVLQDSDDARRCLLQHGVASEFKLDVVNSTRFEAVVSHFAKDAVADELPLNSVSVLGCSKSFDRNLQPGMP